MILAKQIPWQKIEDEYSAHFNDLGCPAKPARVALGSLIIKEHWEAYNESGDLKTQVERYRRRFGVYPESVHADKIYRTRENRQYCKTNGIRLSGPPLGRPKRPTAENAEELKREKKQMYRDEIDRIAIEGKFGQGKRRFSLDRIMAKLAGTSETVIMVVFLVMNLEKVLAAALSFLAACLAAMG